MTTLNQLKYLKMGLKLKDVFILSHLRKLTEPTTLNNFLKINPLIDLTNKNLRLSISKLEQANLLIKFKTKVSLIFIFPFLCSVKKGYKLKPFYLSKQPLLKIKTGQKTPLTFYKYNYINNIYKLKRHNVKNINTNIITHNLDDVNTSNINNIKSFLSKKYGFKESSNKTEQKNVVITKDNFKILSEIKNKFKQDFPDKNSFIDCPLPKNFNYELFISKIKQSRFLKEKHNLGFSWLLNRYEAIINDQYTDFKEKTETQGFLTKETNTLSQREYTKEFLDSLFDNIDNVEI